jgi:hypothetical protein
LADAPLHNSHIFPEFLHRLSYDHTHTLEIHDLAGSAAKKIVQQGLQERLLCRGCEQQLGRWERHASQVLFHSKPVQWKRVGDEMRRSDVDYKQFKLFTLSLIWRASVSTHKEFRNVALGPLEDKVRLMVHKEDPGPHHLYPCFIRMFIEEPTLAGATIIPPYEHRLTSHRSYKALFGGLLWTWVMSGHTGPGSAGVGIIKEDGVLPLLISRHGQERAFFSRIAKRLPPGFFEDEP